MPCSLDHERELARQGIVPVAGVDEAGRGPLAGPVVAAAVILPLDFEDPELDDSKKLTARARERIYARLEQTPGIFISHAVVEPEEIDRINILAATHQAMLRAVKGLPVEPRHILVDGLPVRLLGERHTALVKGDGISLSIAAASIIAKVKRDRIMMDLSEKYPQYGFARHKGYGTAEHLESLARYGPCPAHRRSFAPVAQGRLFLD